VSTLDEYVWAVYRIAKKGEEGKREVVEELLKRGFSREDAEARADEFARLAEKLGGDPGVAPVATVRREPPKPGAAAARMVWERVPRSAPSSKPKVAGGYRQPDPVKDLGLVPVKHRPLAPATMIYATLLRRYGLDKTREIMYQLVFQLLRTDPRRVRNLFIHVSPDPSGPSDAYGWYQSVLRDIKDALRYAMAMAGVLGDDASGFDEFYAELSSMKPGTIDIRVSI